MKTPKMNRKIAPSKTASAKKKDAGKKPAAGAAGKKGTPASRPTSKSSKKEKKPLSSIKIETVRKSLKTAKDLPQGPARAAKKTPVKQATAKAGEIKATKVKKKAVKAGTPGRAAAKQTLQVSSRRASSAPGKSSPTTKPKKTRVAEKKKLQAKGKAPKTAGKKKGEGRRSKPSPSGQRQKVGSRGKGIEKKISRRARVEMDFEDISRIELPAEYGENEVILMPVDPNVIFVDWEIKEEEFPAATERLTMRAFALTGNESPTIRGESSLDFHIEGRVGCGFFDLKMPGREVAVEIGFYDNDNFLPILRSRIVSMPRLTEFDELGIAQVLFGSSSAVGY